MALIEAKGLAKSFGKTAALRGIDLSIDEGRIVGVLGPNGAGKSTALQAIVGLIDCEGELSVLGRRPYVERAALAKDLAFIADVAVMPRWIRVWQALAYFAGVHPRFDMDKAEALLERTGVGLDRKVRDLSKGMVTQLHLSLVLAIDARLLVLDEPTIGLDILFRKAFFDSLLTDFLDGDRTVILATHEVEEVQHILTDVIILDRGRIALKASLEDIEQRFAEVAVEPVDLTAARALKPIGERRVFDRTILTFDSVDADRLRRLGEVRTPGLPDLFAAVVGARLADAA